MSVKPGLPHLWRSECGATICFGGNVSNPEAKPAKIVKPNQGDWNILSEVEVDRRAQNAYLFSAEEAQTHLETKLHNPEKSRGGKRNAKNTGRDA